MKKFSKLPADVWVSFTRRTNDPKLSWLEARLLKKGIPSRRNGRTFHAPILEVEIRNLEKAWKILDPVDDVPDNDKRFVSQAHRPLVLGDSYKDLTQPVFPNRKKK